MEHMGSWSQSEMLQPQQLRDNSTIAEPPGLVKSLMSPPWLRYDTNMWLFWHLVVSCCESTVEAGSPRMVVSGGGDSVVKLWDVHSGREVASMAGHTAEVVSTKWSSVYVWLNFECPTVEQLWYYYCMYSLRCLYSVTAELLFPAQLIAKLECGSIQVCAANWLVLSITLWGNSNK